MPATVTHDFHHDTPVRVITGSENLGFLLARAGAAMAPKWWAHYADGVVEEIYPASGHPRPDPDPAVRTKRVAIPPSIQTQNGLLISHGGRYTGLMRRAVQCQFSRGLETKFSYKWNKTHGIIEYPPQRHVGSTKGEEAELLAARRQWVIEISSQGVFAAPLEIGADCRRCATDVSNYQPKPGQGADPSYVSELSLAWAYTNRNESGAVQQLLDASGIAPAYNKGGPWYTGMGWAFSGSGYAASNVVYRTITAYPKHYETRLLDLAFTISFTGSQISSLISTDGVATAIMPDHGFPNGALVSIFGAEPDDYNGAHIIRNVTENGFQFSVEKGIPTPAAGTPQAANAAGTANIAASLTVGAAGKVTFRINDLGTLWVPGNEKFTRWDGIRPFDYFNCAGPVHVFYDGEQKLVTNWSCQVSNVPGENVLSPRPPLTVIPPSRDPGDFWNGVTFGYHCWGEKAEWLAVAQYNGVPRPPDPPCSIQQWDLVFGSGHSYSPYTNLSWGFGGALSLAVSTYSRRRLESETHPEGSPFHDAGGDWSNNGGYTMCGGTKNCAGHYYWHVYSQFIGKTLADRSESAGGSASMLLFPADREAIAGVKRTKQDTATSNSYARCFIRAVEWHQVGFTSTDGCSFTQFVWRRGGGNFYDQPGQPPIKTTTHTHGMSYALRASGGVHYSGSLIDGASPDWDPFVVYQPGVKEFADSSVFYMGGGLYHNDPGLAPPDQTDNRVYVHDGSTELVGGFADLPTGRTPLAFIGQV